ncbi:MAG: thiol:disulfide interchange protein DsbA/DsbL [Steroidobacter sp.]
MRKWLVSCTLVLSCLASVAMAAAPVQGTDYELLNPSTATSNPAKIVVTEFFSYQCPHCYQFSSLINSWVAKLPADVVFERVPVSFGRPDWASIGQAFYSLQAMNKLDAKMDAAIFNAIHEQRIRLSDVSSIADWLTKQGVNGGEFTEMYNSFGVKMSMNRAEQAAPANRVEAVPTLIIDGKYKVLGNDHVSQLAIADQLIAMVRTARGMPSPTVKTTATATESPLAVKNAKVRATQSPKTKVVKVKTVASTSIASSR